MTDTGPIKSSYPPLMKMKLSSADRFLNSINELLTKAGGINIYLFFILLFTYQIIILFQGLDIVDEGFHATAYQQIFNDPESVQYSFIFWLTDIAGGLVLKFSQYSGLLGLRIAGALVSFLTIVFAYLILKKHLPAGILKLSLVLLTLSINNDPKDIYYNNFSAFLYLISCFLLYSGLTKRNNLFIFAGGFVIGLNIFTRVPNILEPGIGLAIFYYGFSTSLSAKEQIRSFITFTIGCLIAVAGVFAVMEYLNQFHLYVNGIRQLLAISSGASKNDGLNGSYGPLSIIIKPVKQYISTIGSVINIITAITIFYFLFDYTKNWDRFFRTVIHLIIYGIAVVFSITLIKDGIQQYKLIDIYTGLSLGASFFILIRSKNHEIKLICLLGTFLMLIHPLGSAVGIYTVIPYSLWLVFPLAINLLSNIRSSEVILNFSLHEKRFSLPIAISRRTTQLFQLGGLTIVLLTCFYQIVRYPYFCDTHDRMKMTFQIHNKFMKGIYTSKGRAESINELLTASKNFVHPDDYILAFDLLPMYHFWTETRPYIHNPCPWYYTSSVFKHELELSIRKYKYLPVVVSQKISTIGDNSQWPEMNGKTDYAELERNRGRNEVFDKFIKDYDYKVVWQNKEFKIQIPGKTNLFFK